jgi:hypothetical protein
VIIVLQAFLRRSLLGEPLWLSGKARKIGENLKDPGFTPQKGQT